MKGTNRGRGDERGEMGRWGVCGEVGREEVRKCKEEFWRREEMEG